MSRSLNPDPEFELIEVKGKPLWRKVFDTPEAPTVEELFRIGKRDTPDGNPPDIEGDWIMVRNSFTKQGDIYRRVVEWQPKWLHKVHDLRVDRFGLVSGRCDWMCDRNNAWAQRPTGDDRHPKYPFLELDLVTVRQRGVWGIISAEYFGIDGKETEPVFELSNSAGEYPIETHPNFKKWIESSEILRNQIDEDGSFKGFPYGPAQGGEDYENLYGVESYLSFGEVIWRKTWNSRTPPTVREIASIGFVSDPDGELYTPSGRDWIKITDSYTTRGKTHQRIQEWKLSGPKGANPLIYGESEV